MAIWGKSLFFINNSEWNKIEKYILQAWQASFVSHINQSW